MLHPGFHRAIDRLSRLIVITPKILPSHFCHRDCARPALCSFIIIIIVVVIIIASSFIIFAQRTHVQLLHDNKLIFIHFLHTLVSLWIICRLFYRSKY